MVDENEQLYKRDKYVKEMFKKIDFLKQEESKNTV